MANSKLLNKIKGEIKLSDILDELAKYAASKGMKESDFDVILGSKWILLIEYLDIIYIMKLYLIINLIYYDGLFSFWI